MTTQPKTPWPVPIWDSDKVHLVAEHLGGGAHAVVAATAGEETTRGIPQPIAQKEAGDVDRS